MTKTTQGKSPFTTLEITWQMVPHLSNFPCQWLRVSLSPGVCLIRIWLLFLLAENEYRWLRAPKTPYLGFWLWSCAYFNSLEEWKLGTVVTKQSKIDIINLCVLRSGEKSNDTREISYLPPKCKTLGVQIAFYLISVFAILMGEWEE